PALSPFFSHEPSTTDIYTLSLHDALPIYRRDIACYVPTLAQQQLTQQKNPSILFGVLFKEAVYVKPVHELIEPAVAGAIRVSKAEAVPAVLVQVKLDWLLCLVPRFDNAELSCKQEVVSRDNTEHWRRVIRNLDRSHAAIDRGNEVQIHLLRVKRAVHGKTSTCGEAHHPQAGCIDTPFFCALDNHIKSSFGIGQLI